MELGGQNFTNKEDERSVAADNMFRINLDIFNAARTWDVMEEDVHVETFVAKDSMEEILENSDITTYISQEDYHHHHHNEFLNITIKYKFSFFKIFYLFDSSLLPTRRSIQSQSIRQNHSSVFKRVFNLLTF